MSLAKQEFTDAGRSMLGRAQNGERLTITKIVMGSGAATLPSELWPLVDPIATQTPLVNISSQRDYGQGTLLIEGSIRSDQVGTAFYLREVGVYAHIAAEVDRLYSIANVFNDPPDFIDPAAPTVQVFKIKLIIDRIPTGDLTVQIGPSEAVSGENIGPDTVGPGVYKETLGNVLRFKRIVQGAKMDIRESEDGNSIYIGMNLLPNNVDLYVPLTYPGITDPDVLFPTIQAAHDYLLGFTIPPDKRATIHLAAGTFQGAGNSPCYLTHPNASQITLIGQPRVDRVVTAGPNFVDATHKNVTIQGSMTDLIVGMPVYLMNTDTGWAGGCVITAKAGQVLTLSVAKHDAQSAYTINNSGALGAVRLSYYPTTIYEPNPHGNGTPWTADTINVVCGENMTVRSLCIIGGYHCLTVPGNRSVIGNILCLGSGGTGATGIAAGDNCVVDFPSDIVVTDCGNGLTGFFTAHNTDVNVIANGCDVGIGAIGAFGAVPGVAAISGKIYLVHCATGCRNWGKIVSFGNVLFAKNDTGFDAAFLGSIIFGQFANYPQFNGTDLYAHGMGFIAYTKGAGPEPTCNPLKGNQPIEASNQNSYISVA